MTKPHPLQLSRMPISLLAACMFVFPAVIPAAERDRFDYRVLATTKTSTMEKEMNEAGDGGFVFSAVMGGDTAVGGKEAVVIMARNPAHSGVKRTYKLLATSRTSTMQKEMQQLGEDGFEYRGQTVFESTFGGKEVIVIMERDTEKPSQPVQYRLLATTKTSTMQKELKEAGDAGFSLVGMTVAKTSLGGSELVSIMRRQ